MSTLVSIWRALRTATALGPAVAVLANLLAMVLAGCLVLAGGVGLASCSDEPIAQDSHDGGPANLAFLDVETSHAVLDQITPAVVRFYSYDYRQLDEHAVGVRDVSTARYWSEVAPMLEIVRTVAPSKQAVATADVVAAALHVLDPSRAEVLLFVNRSTTEAGGPPEREASSVVVTTARIGSQWKIDGMKLL